MLAEQVHMRGTMLCDDCFITAKSVPFLGSTQYLAVLYPYRDIHNFFWLTMVVPTILLVTVLGALAIFYRQHTRYEGKILRMARYDSLTNLPNRPFAMDRLDAAMLLSRRESWNLAVLFIDLDNFKSVNDGQGHHAGDELLREVAQRLHASVKSSDTVSRLGGDEFFVILQNVKDPGNAEQVAKRLLQQFAEPIPAGSDSIRVEFSVGVAVFPEDADTVDDLLKRADAAMYAAKNSGGNRVVTWAAMGADQSVPASVRDARGGDAAETTG